MKISARGNKGMQTRHEPFFGTQEVLAIRKEHVLHSWLQNDRAHRPLLASSVPPPTTEGSKKGERVQ